jgi:hypothetical protein
VRLGLILLACLLSACAVVAYPVGGPYPQCLEKKWRHPTCDRYYEWVPPYWAYTNYGFIWVDGYYRVRPRY